MKCCGCGLTPEWMVESETCWWRSAASIRVRMTAKREPLFHRSPLATPLESGTTSPTSKLLKLKPCLRYAWGYSLSCFSDCVSCVYIECLFIAWFSFLVLFVQCYGSLDFLYTYSVCHLSLQDQLLVIWLSLSLSLSLKYTLCTKYYNPNRGVLSWLSVSLVFFHFRLSLSVLSSLQR